ncbi:MAG: hypothetical protein U0169_18610 [Polyangiaceae bacterium]
MRRPSAPSHFEDGKDDSRTLGLVALGVALVTIAATHGPLLGYHCYANVDEAYAMALAERLLEGHKLYVGAVSQRGPLMYYAFEFFAWLGGWDSVVALRVVALLFAWAHVLLVAWAGRVLLSARAAAVAVAVCGYALAFGFPPSDGIALHGETLQMPALLVAFVTGALAMRHAPGDRKRRTTLAISGFATGAAIAVKQSVALHPVPLLVWLLVDARRRKAPRGVVVGDVAVFAGATLALPLAFVLHAWADGTLRELWYYTVTFNRDVHMKPTPEHFKWVPGFFFASVNNVSFVATSVVLAALGMPWIARRSRAFRRSPSIASLTRGFHARHYLAANFVLALASGTMMFRFFPHYFIQTLPFMALSVGAAVDAWLRRPLFRVPVRNLTYALAGVTLVATTIGTVFSEECDGLVAHDRVVKDVAKYVEATTAKDDRIFVWGFSSWIYPYAHRRPAGRFVFHTYVTGVVPWFYEKLDLERSRIVPGSIEALLGDLEKEDPAVFVDAGSVMLGRSPRLFEKTNAYLHDRFCFEVRYGAYDIYRRKEKGVPCAQPHFPRTAEVTDWNGRKTALPIPRTLDYATSVPLVDAPYPNPTWFRDGPRPPAAGLEATRDLRREKNEAKGAREGFVVPSLEP